MSDNFILIDKTIVGNNILINALKNTCKYYLYDNNTTSQEIFNYLTENNIINVNRICLIFHDRRENTIFYDFLNNKPLFVNNDLTNNTKSENYTFMINLINTLSPTHVDFLACNLYLYDSFKNYFNSLIENCNNQNLKVGASTNMTGNMLYGGDWILESTGEDIQNIYFNSNISYWTYLFFNLFHNIYYNNYEALDTDNIGNYVDRNGEIILNKINGGLYNIQAWGSSPSDSEGTGYGGNNNLIPLNTTIKKVYSNRFSFNALASDGTVYVWGNSTFSGATYGEYDPNTDSTPLINYIADASYNAIGPFTIVYSNEYSYAGVLENGRIYTWGSGGSGYIKDSSDNYILNPLKIYSSANGFAALLLNGTVFTWGDFTGNNYLKDNSDNIVTEVSNICTNYNAFAALLSNGNVFVWGSKNSGGSNIWEDETTRGYIKDNSGNIITSVTKIFSTSRAFAALNDNGNIFIWGNTIYGGTLIYEDYTTRGYIKDSSGNIISGFTKVSTNFAAFAGILNNGQVFIWGSTSYGGTNIYNDNTYLSYGYLKDTSDNIITNISKVFSAEAAFAAVNSSGNVYVWGNPNQGGGRTYIKDNSDNIISGVTKIYSTNFAFAAYLSNKSVFLWGFTNNGGTYVVGDTSTRGFIKDGSGNIITNVKFIYSNETAFSLVDDSGNVLAWGNQSNGGNLTITPNTLPENYSKYIFSTQYAFCEMTQYAGDDNPVEQPWNQTWIYYLNDYSNFKLKIPFDILQEAIYKHWKIIIKT